MKILEPLVAGVLLVGGLNFVVFGYRLLFSKNYLENYRKRINSNKPQLLSDSKSRFYNKYVIGVSYMLIGSMFIVLGVMLLYVILWEKNKVLG